MIAVRVTPTTNELPPSTWLIHAMQAHRWQRDHGALPLRRAGGSPEERMLGGWISDQRTAAGGTLTLQQAEILDAWVPTWRVGRHTAWLRSVAAHADQVELGDGPRPSVCHLHHLHSIERPIVDAVVGPTLAERQDANFHRRVADLADWVGEHGSYPTKSSPTPFERSLARWHSAQRFMALSGTLPVERLRALNAAVPGWNHQSRFERNIDAVIAFVAANGVWPSAGARAPTRRLGRWWAGVRSAARRGHLSRRPLSARHVSLLDTLVPDWREPRPVQKES